MLKELLFRIGCGVLGVLLIAWAFVLLWMAPVWFTLQPPG